MYCLVFQDLQNLRVSSEVGLTKETHTLLRRSLKHAHPRGNGGHHEILAFSRSRSQAMVLAPTSLPCSSCCVRLPLPILSLIMKTKPSAICLCSPIPNSNPEALDRLRCWTAGFCTTTCPEPFLCNMWCCYLEHFQCLRPAR